MNYTENYQFPQWEETDRVLMSDFNDAMVKVEGAIVSAIMEAKTSSACISGSYAGNGGEITVELGFRPSFLVIVPTGHEDHYNTDVVGAFGFDRAMTQITRNMSCGLFDQCEFSDTGFSISSSELTRSDLTFLYAAFF